MSSNIDQGLGKDNNDSVESLVDTGQNDEMQGGSKVGKITKKFAGNNVDPNYQVDIVGQKKGLQILFEPKKENVIEGETKEILGQIKDDEGVGKIKFSIKGFMDKIGITQTNEGQVNVSRNSIEKVFNETRESGESSLKEPNKDEDDIIHDKKPNIKTDSSESLLDLGEDTIMSSDKPFKLDLADGDDIPLKEKDSIILSSLRVKDKKPLDENPQPSPFTKSIMRKSANNVKKKIPDETTTLDPNYYLDYSAYADYYNDPVEDIADTADELSDDVVRYRDYPMEDGYVRIPVFIPGLEMEAASEVPQLWNAQDAFMRQVGSKLYMFIPSAILGFIIGLLVWVVALAILRTFGVVKKTVIRMFKNQKSDELDLKVKYVTTGDPWIKISDAERIHSVNGAIRKSVIGPCSPDKVVEFNQEVLEEVNRRTPGSTELGKLENEENDEVFAGQGRRSWRVGGQRRSSN